MRSLSNTLRVRAGAIAAASALLVLGAPAGGASAQSITSSAPRAPGPATLVTGQLIGNPGFETETAFEYWAPWSLSDLNPLTPTADPGLGLTYPPIATVVTAQHHCGTAALQLTRYDRYDQHFFGADGWDAWNGSALQKVTIPAAASQAVFSFWFLAQPNAYGADDALTVGVYDGVFGTALAPLRVLDTLSPSGRSSVVSRASGAYFLQPNWSQLTYDLSAFKGQTVQVGLVMSRGPKYPFMYRTWFYGGSPGVPSFFWIDDVTFWTAPHLSLGGC
jgi:hypothetical protein